MRLMSRGNPRVLWNSASMAQGSNKGSSQPALQAVGEVVVELVAVESVEVVANDEALGERFVHGHGEAAAQLGEPDEEQAQAAESMAKLHKSLMSSRTSLRRCWASSMTSTGSCLASHTRG